MVFEKWMQMNIPASQLNDIIANSIDKRKQDTSRKSDSGGVKFAF